MGGTRCMDIDEVVQAVLHYYGGSAKHTAKPEKCPYCREMEERACKP